MSDIEKGNETNLEDFIITISDDKNFCNDISHIQNNNLDFKKNLFLCQGIKKSNALFSIKKIIKENQSRDNPNKKECNLTQANLIIGEDCCYINSSLEDFNNNNNNKSNTNQEKSPIKIQNLNLNFANNSDFNNLNNEYRNTDIFLRKKTQRFISNRLANPNRYIANDEDPEAHFLALRNILDYNDFSEIHNSNANPNINDLEIFTNISQKEKFNKNKNQLNYYSNSQSDNVNRKANSEFCSFSKVHSNENLKKDKIFENSFLTHYPKFYNIENYYYSKNNYVSERAEINNSHTKMCNNKRNWTFKHSKDNSQSNSDIIFNDSLSTNICLNCFAADSLSHTNLSNIDILIFNKLLETKEKADLNIINIEELNNIYFERLIENFEKYSNDKVFLGLEYKSLSNSQNEINLEYLKISDISHNQYKFICKKVKLIKKNMLFGSNYCNTTNLSYMYNKSKEDHAMRKFKEIPIKQLEYFRKPLSENKSSTNESIVEIEFKKLVEQKIIFIKKFIRNLNMKEISPEPSEEKRGENKKYNIINHYNNLKVLTKLITESQVILTLFSYDNSFLIILLDVQINLILSFIDLIKNLFKV